MCYTYDTYRKCISHTGTSNVIFGYNGRDGVVTDDNGFIYMRARYYSPEMRRFINADIVPGRIANAVTLNRYTYANDNPAMCIDPTGLWVGALILGGILVGGLVIGLTSSSKQEESNLVSSTNNSTTSKCESREGAVPAVQSSTPKIMSKEQARVLYQSGQISLDEIPPEYSWEPSIRPEASDSKPGQISNSTSEYDQIQAGLDVAGVTTDILLEVGEEAMKKAIQQSSRPNNIGPGIHDKMIKKEVAEMPKTFNRISYAFTAVFTVVETCVGIEQNINNGETKGEIISDATIDIVAGGLSIATTALLATYGTALSFGWSTIIGLGVGLVYDRVVDRSLDTHFD